MNRRLHVRVDGRRNVTVPRQPTANRTAIAWAMGAARVAGDPRDYVILWRGEVADADDVFRVEVDGKAADLLPMPRRPTLCHKGDLWRYLGGAVARRLFWRNGRRVHDATRPAEAVRVDVPAAPAAAPASMAEAAG